MNQISAAAEAAIRSRIGAVSGASVIQFRAREDDKRVVPASRRSIEVDISLTGWSCSMHQLAMRWRETIELDKGLSGVDQARRMKDMFALRIAKQMERLQTGIGMGLAMPMYAGTESERIDVMHLVLDRDVARLIGDRDAVVRRMQESIHALHAEPDDGLRDVVHGDETLTGRVWTAPISIADGAIFYGDELWVRHALPETVIVAAPGRRLGDIVDGLPEGIAGRVVRGAERSDDGEGVEFAVKPDNATAQAILSEMGAAS